MSIRLSVNDCLRLKTIAEKATKDFANKRGVICAVTVYWQFMHGKYYDSTSCSNSSCKCSVDDYHDFIICLIQDYKIGVTIKLSNLVQVVSDKFLKTFSKNDKKIYLYIQETKNNPKFLDLLEYKYGFYGINKYIRNFGYTRIYEIIISQIPFLDINYRNIYKYDFEVKFISMIVNHILHKNMPSHVCVMSLYDAFVDFTNQAYTNSIEHFCLQLFKMNIPIVYRNNSIKNNYFPIKSDIPIKEAIDKYSIEYVIITKMFSNIDLFKYICVIYEIEIDLLKVRFKKDIERVQEFQKSVKKDN